MSTKFNKQSNQSSREIDDKIKKRPPSDDEDSDDDDDGGQPRNKFANDGSFLEMFKKMQQQQQQEGSKGQNRSATDDKPNDQSAEPKSEPSSAATNLAINKRKPKILKVGMIEKSKKLKSSQSNSRNQDGNTDSAWSRYMNEVRAYKEKYGDDEDKNRPLVK